jgi:HD superfamily phosphohydrolase
MVAEKKTVRRPRKLTQVKDFLKDTYILDSELDSGGTGIVYRGHKASDATISVAVKFYVISAQASFLNETTFRALILPEDEGVFDTEFHFLKQTRHPGVQELISYGILDDARLYFGHRPGILLPDNGKVRFLISRFIDGPRLRDWVIRTVGRLDTKDIANRISDREARQAICRVIHDVAETLHYIHQERRYQHSDLRADNIIVHSASERPVVIDFGYAHCFDPALADTATQIRYMPENMPEALVKDIRELVRTTGSNVVNRDELRRLVFPGLDLHNLGKLLEDLIQIPGVSRILSSFDRDFLHLITRRLRDWRTAKESNAGEVAGQLKKMLLSLRSPGHATSPGVDKHIALPTGGLDLTPTVEKLLNTRAMRRLQLLNQLSFVNMIYPGASQTRFEHSLGVYVTATRLVDSLARSPRFRILFDEAGVTKLLLVCLLHDVNHFPFLHYFQELNDPALKQIDFLNLFCAGEATGDSPSVYELVAGEGMDPTYLRAILFGDEEALTDPQMQVIRSIIDGGVDVDKMTYVRDDARHTGVPFGQGVDYDALFEHADIARIRSSDPEGRRPDEEATTAPIRYHLCFGPGARSAVESLLMARFWNFRQIYWHHSNRAISSMILHVISRVFGDGSASYETFIRETIGRSETGALELLNAMHREKFRKPAITADLGSRRNRMYRRIISINAAWERGEGAPSGESTRLFNELSRISVQHRETFLSNLRDRLEDLFKEELGERKLDADDLLLDVPGRSLDEQIGQTHVVKLTPDGRPEYFINSPFILQLREQFAALSRTIRIFVAPDVRDLIGEKRLEQRTAELRRAVQDALAESHRVPNAPNAHNVPNMVK